MRRFLTAIRTALTGPSSDEMLEAVACWMVGPQRLIVPVPVPVRSSIRGRR